MMEWIILMSRFRIVSTIALAALVTTGCASGTGGASSTTADRGSRNVITRAQLDEIDVSDVHQAVQRLQSSWLRPRRTTNRLPNAPILVYVDGVRAGRLDFLQTISVERVERLQFVNASDATTRWGTGHGSGVIEVTMK